MIGRIAALCLAAVATAALHWATAIGMIRWSPDVVRDLRVLPGRPLSETVLTKTPQSIEVTIALVPIANTAYVSSPRAGEGLDPNAKVVLHFVSAPSVRGSPLEHQINLPALPAGLYQIRLASPERTAVQNLTVGTIGAVMNRGNNGAVVLAIDARTLRMRRDVVVLDYGVGGVRRFFPSKDGLIHVPAPAAPQGVLCSPEDAVVVRASDGSLVSFSGTGCSLGLATYFDTDRHMYRAGDRVYYRIFSRDATTNTYATVVGGNFWYTKASRTVNHVTDGGFMLPLTANADYWSTGGFYVANSAHSRYEIEAAALTPVVDAGEAARFVISATLADGTPATGLRLHYAWHSTNYGANYTSLQERAGANGGTRGDPAYGDVTTDAQGNAIVAMPVEHDSLEMYVYDPDTNELVTSARAVVFANQYKIAITAPFFDMAPACIPLAARETTARGTPLSGRHLHVEVRPQRTYTYNPLPAPVLTRELVTNADGYAIARWCTPGAEKDYTIAAVDERSGIAAPWTGIRVRLIPNWNYTIVILSADTPRVRPGTAAGLTATSASDGDAFVSYGSDYDIHSQSARVEDGVAHIVMQAPPELDDFEVGLVQATRGGDARGTAQISVAPKTHLFRVQLGCGWRKAYFCVRVSNWRGKGTDARLFVDITAATRASIVNEMARSGDAYEALYSPRRLDNSLTASLAPIFGAAGSLGAPGTSYLYPHLPPPESRVPPNQSHTAPATPAPSAPKPLEPQTVLWLNGVPTNPMGYAKISLTPKLKTDRYYLIHVVALGNHGEIGEAYTWIFA
jgi:hypothetical protein